jgi:hypothetical protein
VLRSTADFQQPLLIDPVVSASVLFLPPSLNSRLYVLNGPRERSPSVGVKHQKQLAISAVQFFVVHLEYASRPRVPESWNLLEAETPAFAAAHLDVTSSSTARFPALITVDLPNCSSEITAKT